MAEIFKRVLCGIELARLVSCLEVYWISHATQVPSRSFSQEEVFRFTGYPHYPSQERRKLQALFQGAGVERRAICLDDLAIPPSEDPNDFHSQYLSGIRKIVPQAAEKALSQVGLPQDRPTANLLGMVRSLWC
jgi:predicted naringenin-chalcone synthase